MNPKILRNPYYYSAKMAPKKVDKLMPLKVAKLMPLWRPKCGQTNASPAYICMPDGRMWDHFFQKTGWFGVHLRAGSGPTRVSHNKNKHFRGTVGRLRKRPKSHNCTPHGAKTLFCKNTNLNFCTGYLSAIPVWQGVALINIGFLKVTLCQGFCACTNLKIFV